VRILAIRGHNLASLARSFAVELTEGDLADAGIFAICGPVGAGKSTLLDALCLALFDRTPRLAGRGGAPIGEENQPAGEWLQSHDPRTLLRRGAGEGWAEVDFTGRDGRRYRARWTVRRARRRAAGRMQAQEMTLTDLDGDVVVARSKKTEVLEAIRTRLGLDFAQFCRSVLLAQGDFAAFLRASPDERASLLESLTGADLYRRLSKAAHERRKAKKDEIERLVGQAQSFELLDDEQRKQLEQQVEALNKEQRTCQLGVELAQGVVAWYRTAAQLRSEEDQATCDLRAVTEANVAAEPRRAQLHRLQEALALVPRSELVAERRRALDHAAGVTKAAERSRVDAAEVARSRHARQRAAVARVLPTTEGGAPPVVADFERWQATVRRWTRAIASADEIGLSAAELESRVQAAARQHDEAVAARNRARDALAEPVYAGLGDTRRQLLADRQAIGRQGERVRAWQRSADDQLRAEQAVAKLTTEREELARDFPQLVASDQAAERELLRCRAALEHVRTRTDLAAFRSHLVDGEPCPLCGSAEHPDPAGHADDALQQANEALDRAARDHDASRDAVRAREAARRTCETALRQAQDVMRRTAAELATAVAAFAETCDDTAAQLESALAQVDSAEQDLAQREQAFGELADRQDKEQRACSAAERIEREALLAMQGARQQQQRAVDVRAVLEEVQAELEPAFAGVADWQSRLRTLGDRVADVLMELANADGRCREADRALAAREADVVEAEKLVAHAESELAAADTTFEDALNTLDLGKEDVRQAGELGAEALHSRRAELQDLTVAVERERAVLQKCVELRRRHESNNRPAIVEDDAAGAHEDAQRALEGVRSRLETVRAQLAADDLMRRQRGEITPRLQRLEAEFETLRALDDLIGHSGGDKFAVFAQGLTLDLLLIEANRRLAELSPRFQLHKNRNRDMDFVIVDLDLGGARRGLQTLSGGETFLVSLALALALATLAAPRSRVETLFLDEGFGTLDAHHLEIALGALDSLQAKGCQVGIISHVDGIAERIGVVVDVVPEGGGQSRVRIRTG